jgi:hypothetical protein
MDKPLGVKLIRGELDAQYDHYTDPAYTVAGCRRTSQTRSSSARAGVV